MTERRSKINPSIQRERRELLIDATISAIAEMGLGRLTLAKIAGMVGLSAGSVNFHFSTKEALLLATLTHVADEFQATIKAAMARAGKRPEQQLDAVVQAYLDPEVTEPRKMAVWHAFSSEARAREDYQRICGPQDKHIFDIILRLCRAIIRQGNKEQTMSAFAMANAVQGLLDDTWQTILYTGPDHDREQSETTCKAFLASVFPWCFEMPRRAETRTGANASGRRSFTITSASVDDLKPLTGLFDAYRQFYAQAADQKLAEKFIGENLRKQRSTIFLARDNDGEALGFTQLYPALCSVEAKPVIILYDLFVTPSARKMGIARALMDAAEKFARKSKACRIDLETAVDNLTAQSLYDNCGYERDNEFYKYSLALD
jgi:TetR/AcrR family transcriptional repressor of bet genes